MIPIDKDQKQKCNSSLRLIPHLEDLYRKDYQKFQRKGLGMIRIEIPGNPKSKDRPRFVKGHVWSPTGKGEYDTGWDIYTQYRGQCKKRGVALRDPRKHLIVHVKYFYQEKRKNGYLDEANMNCWLADCIEKSGIIFNDKILRILVDDYQHNKDIKDPRTEIIIEEG